MTYQSRPISAIAVGRALRSARTEAGLTLFELARRMPKRWQNSMEICRWEKGGRFPSLAAVDAYARACGVSLREVLP